MNAIVPASTRHSAVLQPNSFAELVQFANMAAKSALVPKDYQGRPENVMLAVQMGSEIGLSPMQALQNIAVVNGRPAVWGDAMPGLCKASAVCDDIEESLTGEGDAMIATCIARRRGAKPVTATFSAADAKRAGLWSKPGPWQQYPQRMLKMRARSWALRDAFPDVLKGLIAAEEAGDIPPDAFSGTTILAEPVAPEPEIAAPAKPSRPTFRDTVRGLCAAATTIAEIEEIEARADYSNAVRKAAPEIADELRSIVAEARARLAVPRKLTVTEWLDALEKELVEAATAEAVDEITARSDVQKALDRLTNGARDRLNAMCKAALARTADVGPDGDLGGVE